jgi:hypothetical protein
MSFPSLPLAHRKLELQLEQKKAREELGAASTEMQERHRQIIADIEEQLRTEAARQEAERAAYEADKRAVYDQKERLKEQVRHVDLNWVCVCLWVDVLVRLAGVHARWMARIMMPVLPCPQWAQRRGALCVADPWVCAYVGGGR